MRAFELLPGEWHKRHIVESTRSDRFGRRSWPIASSRTLRPGSGASWSVRILMATATTGISALLKVTVNVAGLSTAKKRSRRACHRVGLDGFMAGLKNRRQRPHCRPRTSKLNRSRMPQARLRLIFLLARYSAAVIEPPQPATMKPGVLRR